MDPEFGLLLEKGRGMFISDRASKNKSGKSGFQWHGSLLI